MMDAALQKKIQTLPCWSGPVDPLPVDGGITNFNFTVTDRGEQFLVRLGQDIPHHQIMRFNERAASRAAAESGLAPEVIHADEQALVIRFIQGRTLHAEDLRDVSTLKRVIPVVTACHDRLKHHLRGPALAFWVFHVIRDYAKTLQEAGSRVNTELPRFLEAAEALEQAVMPVTLVFAHNDLLPENFIDDGEKIWLVDWEYAGFNSPLFDLGGLSSNAGLDPEQEELLLEAYFQAPVQDELRYRYLAMKTASLLRETLWSLVSEIYSQIDFDYQSYSDANLRAFESLYTQFKTW